MISWAGGTSKDIPWNPLHQVALTPSNFLSSHVRFVPATLFSNYEDQAIHACAVLSTETETAVFFTYLQEKHGDSS